MMTQSFDSEKLRYTQEKLNRITELVNSWIGKQGHDSCWYYPDIFKSICNELGIEWEQPELPLRSEFAKGCLKFENEVYGEPRKVRLEKCSAGPINYTKEIIINKYRCTKCQDTQLVPVEGGLDGLEFCDCYYAGGRMD